MKQLKIHRWLRRKPVQKLPCSLLFSSLLFSSLLFAVSCELSTVNHGQRQDAQGEFQFSCISRFNPRRENSVRHRSDFFFDLGNIDHDDGVPWAAIQEAAVRTLAKALLAPDALDGINLDAAKRRIVLVRHPEHAIFHRTVLHAGGRSRATGAALGDDGKFFRLLFARECNSLGARLLFQLVGHHSWGFDNFGRVSHFQRFYLECQAFASLVFPRVPCLLQCPCNPFHLRPHTCSPSHLSDISHRLCWPDLPCASSSFGISLFLPGIQPITKSLPATGCTTTSTASIPTGSFFPRMPAPQAIPHSSRGFISWLVPAERQSCSRKPSSILPRVSWPRASPLVWPRVLPAKPAAALQRLRFG